MLQLLLVRLAENRSAYRFVQVAYACETSVLASLEMYYAFIRSHELWQVSTICLNFTQDY